MYLNLSEVSLISYQSTYGSRIHPALFLQADQDAWPADKTSPSDHEKSNSTVKNCALELGVMLKLFLFLVMYRRLGFLDGIFAMILRSPRGF